MQEISTGSAPGALAETHRLLALDPARNTQIADDIQKALARGRNCLVLTRRIAQVEALTTVLAARGHPALVLQGSMSATDRRAVVGRLAALGPGSGHDPIDDHERMVVKSARSGLNHGQKVTLVDGGV